MKGTTVVLKAFAGGLAGMFVGIALTILTSSIVSSLKLPEQTNKVDDNYISVMLLFSCSGGLVGVISSNLDD